MAARYPTHSSTGRALRPSRKLRERLKDQVQMEFDGLVTELSRWSQTLQDEMVDRKDGYVVEETLGDWKRVCEEMMEAENEMARFMLDDELTAHRNAFSPNLRYFRQLEEDVVKYLHGIRQDYGAEETQPDGDDTVALQRRIQEIEKDISDTASRLEQTKIEEKIHKDRLRQRVQPTPQFASTPMARYPGFPDTPEGDPVARFPVFPDVPEGEPPGRRSSILHQAENPLNYRDQYFHHVPTVPQVFTRGMEDQRRRASFAEPRRQEQYTRYEELEDSGAYGYVPPRPQRYQEPSYRVPLEVTAPSQAHRRPPVNQVADPALSVLDRLASILQDKKDHKLPSIEPEKFSGDIMKFPAWLASFEALIECKFRTSGERMFYLQKYTTGEARDLLSGFEDFQSEDSYPNAKMLLVTRYGDKLRISETYRQKLNDWAVLKAGDHLGLQKYSDFLWKCYKAMETIGYLNSLNSPEENRKMVKKMPFYVIDRWQRVIDLWVYDQPADLTQLSLSRTRPYPPFLEFCKFIANEARVANGPCSLTGGTMSSTTGTSEKKNDTQKKWSKKATALATKSEDVEEKKITASKQKAEKASPSRREEKTAAAGNDRMKPLCWFCEKDHWISSCEQFLTSPFEEKKMFAMSKGLCFGCLRRGHTYRTCTIRRPELMRDPNREKGDVKEAAKESAPPTDNATAMTTRITKADGYCSSIVPVWVSSEKNPEKEILTYLVIDSQSDSHFMSTSLAEKLNITGIDVNIRLVTMGTTAVVPSSVMKGIHVRGWNQEKKIDIAKCYTRDIIPANKATIPSLEDVRRWQHLSPVADQLMEFDEELPIELMIGFKCSDAFIQEERVYGKASEPFGYKSALGWSVMGKLKEEEKETDDHMCFITTSREVNHEQIKKVFDMGFETYGKEEKVSQEDRRFLQVMSDTIRQRPDKHMETDLPLKDSKLKLPNNRLVAERRLKSLNKKLLSNKEYSDQYTKFINNMIEKGQAELVEDGDKTIEGLVWYLPHMGVYHPRKPKKLRVVFDASVKFLSSSLNESLMTGPDLTNSLVGVLLRFRCEKIAVTCDVEGMFHQVFVSPRFRDLLRFLWYKGGDPNEKIEEYRVCVNLFGASSSPGCSNYAFQEVARRFEEEYGAMTAAFILRHFYVDDGIISVRSVEEAVDLIFSSHGMCKEGGFWLHKYASNSQAVLDQIPDVLKSEEAKTLRLDEGDVPTEMTLGVGWSRLQDCFVFLMKLKMNAATRRGMLSSLSSIYDPLGFLTPIILLGRIILRDICCRKFDWDEQVDEDVQRKWAHWYEQLQNLDGLQIPRCVKMTIGENATAQLHMFCDASTVGYGACGYVRLQDENGEVETNLILSKSRVGPSKQVTIPRLELQAAVLAVKVGNVLKSELPYEDPKIFYWSDSQVTLGYIRNSAKRFHVYVSNRVASIREMSRVEDWHYIETDQNPADTVSRGALVKDLIDDDKWWKGPKLIQESKVILPEDENLPLNENDPEIKQVKTSLGTKVEENILLSGLYRQSTWKKMKTSLAIWRRYMLILRTCKNRRKEYNIETKPLTVHELRRAEREILINIQKQNFPEVYHLLESTKKYPITRAEITKRKSVMRRYTNLYKLDAYLDGTGLMRVGGRIKRASMTHEMKHPILLPRSEYVTQKIIQHYHDASAHSGRGITMMSLRTAGYWIINYRSEIDKALRMCVLCRKLRGIPMGQRMGDLPKARLEEAPPFAQSGMDVFGPFELKIGRSLKKRWICIFVCMAMRGIHVEVLHSMDVSSFISAFRRFEARRGAVKELYSDRGSNFIGSRNELAKARKEMSVEEISKKLADADCELIQFNFNYPKSSHMGGSWERMIRTVRGVLARLLAQHGGQLDDELLLTLMAEAESIVNSRPITYAGAGDGSDIEPITPMMLLTLKSQVVLPPPGIFVKEDLYCTRRWRRVQYLANLFWQQWSKDFVPSLQERRKWIEPEKNVKTNDIVLIADMNVKRNQWAMGRVMTVAPGEDQLVRKATIKTQHGEYERPVHKLVFVYRPNEDE